MNGSRHIKGDPSGEGGVSIDILSKPLYVGKPNIANQELFLEYAKDILESGRLSNDGPYVRRFEEEIAQRLNVRHCVAVCNATVALEIAARALDLEGEVIVPSYTFIATAHSLKWLGLEPVFADIHPDTHNLDPVSVKEKINERTTAILAVNLWGRAAPVKELQEIADDNDLKLFFDSAHAFATSYKGSLVGGFGECEIFSFHATKVLNTFEGGAITTNDDVLAETLRQIRNFGFSGVDCVSSLGTNGKMQEISAAMGLANLMDFDRVVEKNKENYLQYKSLVEEISGLSLIEYDLNEINNYHYIVMVLDDEYADKRDVIIDGLQNANVYARKYFWPGCHKMEPYKSGYINPLSLQWTEKVSKSVIVLPSGPQLHINEIEKIVHMLKKLMK